MESCEKQVSACLHFEKDFDGECGSAANMGCCVMHTQPVLGPWWLKVGKPENTTVLTLAAEVKTPQLQAPTFPSKGMVVLLPILGAL